MNKKEEVIEWFCTPEGAKFLEELKRQAWFVAYHEGYEDGRTNKNVKNSKK